MKNSSLKRETEIFNNMPVIPAVLSLVVPTVISQLIIVLYNVADTFFIGQTGDANQVAASNLSMPLLFLLMGAANLFGIGGASCISRYLGAKKYTEAKNTSAFCIWSTAVIAFAYGILIYILFPVIMPRLGANVETINYCRQYVFWTVTIGAVPTVLSSTLAHLVRAQGYATQASVGMILGATLNMLLDYIFIYPLKMQIAGAAIATMLSNTASTLFFIIFILANKSTNVITVSPKYFTLKKEISTGVLLVGLPSALMCLMSTLSNSTLNLLMASYCNQAIAGVGIAKKIDLVAFGIATGISQGVVPLIGYNYSAKNFTRMKKAIKVTFIISIAFSCTCAILLFTCAAPIVKLFIDDALTVQYGRLFQRIICISGPCISITLIIISVFQSVGKKVRPLLLSLLRKGGLDIPFMLLFNSLYGINGIVWATPIADFAATAIAICVFIPFLKKEANELK